MAWVRLDDAILDNPKIIAAGPLGFALHVAAITWCGRNLTDGVIPKRRVPQLLDLPSLQVSETTKVRVLHALTPDDLAADLVRIGLWHDRGDTWEVHDYLKYNFSRAQVLARRKKTLKRVNKHRDLGCNAVTNAAVTHLPIPIPIPKEDLLPLASLALGFDEFWARYPKKRHKPAALKAWKAAHADPKVVLDGLTRWNASDAWKRGFIEDASTFLNQRQWEDEPRAPARTAERSTGALPPQTNYTQLRLEAERQRRRNELSAGH